VLLLSPYHNPSLDLFQIFYTLLTSLNVRISRGLEEFHSLNLAKSALVTKIRKDDWSRAVYMRIALMSPRCDMSSPHAPLKTSRLHGALT
jgi:hypothetical protein